MSGEMDAPSDSDPADLLPLLVELSSHKAAAARTAPPGTGHRDAGGETQQPGNSSAASGPADEELKPRYAELNMWVTEWFAPVIERRLQSGRGSTPGLYWCEFWWDHPEAIFRLYAIWREWEKARAGDTMSAWARDHTLTRTGVEARQVPAGLLFGFVTASVRYCRCVSRARRFPAVCAARHAGQRPRRRYPAGRPHTWPPAHRADRAASRSVANASFQAARPYTR